MYPAISVHHPLWNLLYDAVNRVPNILLGGHQKTRSHQDDEACLDEAEDDLEHGDEHGYLVVEPEDVVVDAYLIKLDQTLHRAKHVKHCE